MVSQPYQRTSEIPSPREINPWDDNFWIGSPWKFESSGKNLSAFEPNHVFLNLGDRRFLDVSYLSGADSDGDGRGVCSADLDRDGRPDLVVRQAGGGPLRIYRNRLPKRSWLRVELRGTKSNSFGIGARVEARTGDQRVVRQLRPNRTFATQSPHEIHMGLGDASRIDQLTVHWPSGLVQTYDDVAINRHVRLTEGSDEIQTVTAPSK